MSVIFDSSARRIKAPREFSVKEINSETLTINGTSYAVERFRPAGEFGTHAVRLTKLAGNGDVYDVVRTNEGTVECDCPDFEARHRGNGTLCKHARALVQIGHIPAPGRPAAQPTAAPAPATANVLEPTAEEREAFKAPLAPLPTLSAPEPVVCSTLPTIQGAGLSRDEFFRINGAMNRTRAAYAADCPEADACELDRVARAAGRDALRIVLRDRSAAAPCCPAGESQPCAGCSVVETPASPAPTTLAAQHAAETIDPWDVESDPADWPVETDNWLWTTGDDAPPDDEPTGDDREALAAEIAPSAPVGGSTPARVLTMLESIEAEAARFLAAGTRLGEILARAIQDVADVARLGGPARTPIELEDRLEELELARNWGLDRDPGDFEPDPEFTSAGTWVGHDA